MFEVGGEDLSPKSLNLQNPKTTERGKTKFEFKTYMGGKKKLISPNCVFIDVNGRSQRSMQ